MKRIIIIATYLLLFSCGDDGDDSSPSRQEGWTDIRIKVYVDSCTEGVIDPNPNMSDYTDNSGKTCLTLKLIQTTRIDIHTAREYCKCVINEASYRYTYLDVVDYTCTVIENMENDGVYDNCFNAVRPK